MRFRAYTHRSSITLFCLASLWLPAALAADAPTDPPWRHALGADDAKRVTALEEQIEKLELTGKFADAHQLADQIVSLRTRAQGKDHWETAFARRRAEALK